MVMAPIKLGNVGLVLWPVDISFCKVQTNARTLGYFK